MPSPHQTRRRVLLAALSTPFWSLAARAAAPAGSRTSIVDVGAVADGATVNTRAIQSAIDSLAAKGGGTVVVPKGVFVSGALFLKPKVNLHFEQGAVLRCSTDMKHFPPQRTRIEGHFEESFNPALINASACDGLQITGAGTLDGAGMPIWEEFWRLRKAAPDPHNFKNLGVPRARLALIENSRGVVIDGITFKDSQFWNLHLYKCQQVQVRNSRFEVPDDYKQAPSTDGIDLDSCQDVTVDGCTFSVTDDCIAAKGSKGPHAMQDKDSPPVERIRIRNCTFKRGNGALTLGSEATVVRDIVVENCTVTDANALAVIKLRPDTPQHYEDIHFRNITLAATRTNNSIIAMRPWSQYFDLKGEAPPKSVVRNISFEGIKGRMGTFGAMKPNPGQTSISDIRFKDVDVQLAKGQPDVAGVEKLRYENVVVNGKPLTA